METIYHASVRVRRIVCWLLLSLHLTGCVTWRTVPTEDHAQLFARWAARTASGNSGQEAVRVTRGDGTVVLFENPSVRADSIVDARGSMAVDEVERIEDRGVSAGATIALVGASVLVLALYYVAAVQSCLSDRTRDC
jgi:hypothetical protein